MFSGLMQDWTTMDGAGTAASVQARADWLDMAMFGDIVFWLEVRAVSNPGAGTIALAYETSPTSDDSLFQPLATVTLAASATPVVTKVQLSSNPAVPLARFVRWKLVGTAAGNWSVTFRIFAMANKGSAGLSDPSALALTGWWRAPYSGAPWAGTPSAGASGGRDMSDVGSAPGVGASVNGYAPPLFVGASSNSLASAVNNDVYFGGTGSLFCLFYANTAPAPSGAAYGDGTFFTDPTNAETTFGFTSSGICGCIYDGTYTRIDLACGTGAWHLAQLTFDGTNLNARVDGGAWSSVACGAYTPVTPGSVMMGRSYAALHFDGRILELGVASYALGTTELDGVRSYINARYGLAV